MTSPHKLFWMILLLALVMPCIVQTAPTGVQEQPEANLDSEEFQEVVEETGKLEKVDEAIEKSLEEDKEIDKGEGIPANGDQPEASEEDEEEEIVQDTMDKGIDDVIDDVTDDIIEDFKDGAISDDTMSIDDAITGSSSEPDATDYLWEPSFNYDSVGKNDLNPRFLYNLPYDSTQWSSNSDIFDEEYFPDYESSYESMNEVGTNNLNNNNLDFDILEEVFEGIPKEELNNKVDQTVDEFLCMLGLCDDIRVYPEDDELEEPDKTQFTEEGMMGNNGDERESEEDIYTVDVQHEDPNEEATKSSTEVKDDDESSSRPEQDAPSSPEGSRHRSKRDLSWDEVERDNVMLDEINSLDRLREEEETDQGDLSLTAEDRFEDLLEYFKGEAAENENKEGFYLGVPEPVLDELVADATSDEFQDDIEEEDNDQEDGIEETGEFVEDEEDVDDWGAYLVPGSPYSEDTLRYDGYKRDDEREALKVYIESLQNMEGYRKRGDQGDYLDDDSRSATNFLRKLVPRSPPNAIRYPKTGLEPFSREKYFPLFPEPDGMADDDTITDIDPEDVLAKYNELMDLLSTEIEAAALISTIQDMAAELGRDQRLLDELEEEEAEDELQLAMDENNQEILELVGIGHSRPMKRAPRVIDYLDFNEYPPEFHRSISAPRNDGLSEEELIRLYNDNLNEAAEEAEWGDFIYQPRERREGEDSLPGPYGGYYVQGRMIGNLMKPKRDWEAPNDVDDELPEGFIPAGESDHPYVLLDPSDLGYNEWPGDFEIFYDTRDGTFVMYPYHEPQDANVISGEALLDALGLPGRNFVVDADVDDDDDDEEEEEGEEEEMEEEEMEDVQEDGKWGDFIADDNVLQDDLQEIDEDINQLEDLRLLAEIAEELKIDDDKAAEEAKLLRALLWK